MDYPEETTTVLLREELTHGKHYNYIVVFFQNLTFDAYFKSTVNESFGCSYNLRKCKIIYFLEDDTIKVVEPVVINSGLPQGMLCYWFIKIYFDSHRAYKNNKYLTYISV